MPTSGYTIELSKAAAREMRKLPRQHKVAVATAIESLASEPRPVGCTKLTDADGYRIRVGDYRVVYDIHDEKLVVLVLHVGNRDEIYRLIHR